MDIQVSSNFERLINFYLKGNNKKLKNLYSSLEKSGKFKISKSLLKEVLCDFYGGKVNNKTTENVIKTIYNEHNIVVDPHTAVGIKVGREYNIKNDKIIFLATAHYAKFLETVKKSINKDLVLPADLKNLMNKKEIYNIINDDTNELESFLLKNS